MSITVRDAVYDLLRQAGMTTIFGNPGSTELPMFRAFPQDFRYVLGLQESVVVGMADGYAQATNRPAVVNLHSAGGVGHALGSLFTAYRNRTPMVLIAGQQARSMLPHDPFLYAQEATEFPKPYVKFSLEPARAQDVPLAIARAYYMALQPPAGPVFVSVPVDDWDQVTQPVQLRELITDTRPDPVAIRTIAMAIANARAPAFVYGGEVDRSGAWNLAVQLAERHNGGVFTPPGVGRCSFPESHPLFRGFLPSMREKIVDRLRDYDLVLAVGTAVFPYHIEGFGEFLPPGCELIQITEDPVAASSAVAGRSVVCSPRLALADLLAQPSRSQAITPSTIEKPPDPAMEDSISPALVMSILAKLRPANCVHVHESPSGSPGRQAHLPIDTPESFYQTASGGLGFGLPAAVGLALGRPDRKVIATLGDGSSMYTIQGLWSAAQLGLPITFVILNNRKYKTLQTFAGYFDMAPDLVGIDLAGLDFVSIARGHGCDGVRVTKAQELEAALRGAIASDKPALVEVIMA